MDFKVNSLAGATVSIDPTKLTDEQLLMLSAETAEAARSRGLELPAFVGSLAVEATIEVETDLAESRIVTYESILDQVTPAFKAYQAIAEEIKADRSEKEQITITDQETVEHEFNSWFTTDKLEYVTSAMEADPTLRFTLVATPNILATSEEIIKAAKTFGEKQPLQTHSYDKLCGKYTAQQLSGTNPDNGKSVQFSLIPNKFNPTLYGTVDQQKAELAKLQAANASLKVPSVLEAVTYWLTLRAHDDSLDSGAAFHKTFIRHFNLPERNADCYDSGPYSYVGVDGKPRLYGKVAHIVSGARVSLG